ncbi:MAG: hypothetical protein AB7E30_09385 [Lawsonibacter sp.]
MEYKVKWKNSSRKREYAENLLEYHCLKLTKRGGKVWEFKMRQIYLQYLF